MSDLDALLQSLSGVENPNALPSFAAPAQPGMAPEGADGEPAYEDALVRVAVARQQREERVAAGTEPGYEDHEETDEERNARLVMLRGLNPALEAYKLPVMFLDGCRAEYDVTEDWTVGELTAAVANSIGVLDAAPLFHICQGVRTSNAVISPTNYEKWLPRATTLAELGFTAKTAAVTAAGAPLVFRMRWFKMPCDRLLEGNVALVHQLFLHAKRSLSAENVPLDTDIAVRLVALYLQAAHGDYDPAKIRQGMIASAPEGTYFSRSVQDAVGDLVKLEGLTYDAYSALRGMQPIDAERRFLDIAQSTWCPLTGATVYMISGTTGVRRRTVVLSDGLAVELGTTLRFHPLKDIADVQLSPDRRTVAITVLTPFTAAQRPGDPQPREVMRFTTDEAPSIYELLVGYITLARPVLPPGAPDTSGLLPPLDDLPPPSFCDAAAPLRENILLEQSVAHAFCKRFAAQCAAHKVTPPPYVAALFREALQSFPVDGFNEYRFCKTHGVPSAAHLRDDFAVPALGYDEFVEMQESATAAPSTTTTTTTPTTTAATAGTTGTTSQPPRLPFEVVRDIDLSNVALKKGHLEALGEALSYVAPYMEKTGVPQNFVLRRLALCHNIVNEPEAVIQMLRAVCSSAVPLARLAVRHLSLGARDVGDLMAAVLASKQLEEVCVDHNPGLGDEGFFALANGLAADLPRLVRLSFINCGVTGAGLTKLPGVLNRYKRPRALCLRGNDLGSKGGPAKVAELLTRCTPLESLDLRGCDLGKGGVLTIVQALPECTTLRRLDVADNGAGDKPAARLAELVAAGTCYISAADLSANKVGKKPYVALLAALTSPSARLTSLRLADTELPKAAAGDTLADLARSHVAHLSFARGKVSKTALASLAGLLGTCTSLRSLDLSGNTFPADALAAFGTALRAASHLERLDLSGCAAKPDTLGAFCAAAAGNSSLRRLALNGVRMSASALGELAALLNTHTSHIATVELRGLVAPQDAVAEFFHALSNSGALTCIDLRGAKISRIELSQNYLRLTNVHCVFSPDAPAK